MIRSNDSETRICTIGGFRSYKCAILQILRVPAYQMVCVHGMTVGTTRDVSPTASNLFLWEFGIMEKCDKYLYLRIIGAKLKVLSRMFPRMFNV